MLLSLSLPGYPARTLFGPFSPSRVSVVGVSAGPEETGAEGQFTHGWPLCLGENFLESDCVCSVYLACLSGEPSLASLVPLSSLKPWKVLCAHLFVCAMLAVRCSFDSSLRDCMLAGFHWSHLEKPSSSHPGLVCS